MWLAREIGAQLSRFGLALGLLSACVVVGGLCLPMIEAQIEAQSRLGAQQLTGSGLRGPSPVRIDNALIGYSEGWVVLGLAAGVVAVLALYRPAGRFSSLASLAIVGTGLSMAMTANHIAQSNLLHPCNERVPGGLLCDPTLAIGYQNLPTGYGFELIDLGALGVVGAGLLLLLPAAAPRRHRRTFAGREDVVWL